MTRQNFIPSEDSKSQVNALIPLWDMCNHTNGNISTDYNPDLDRCECLAVRKFTAGEQLFIFYGPRTNADLFVHNGFVYEENQHDYYPLNLGISQSDALREKRLKILSKLKIDNIIFRLKRDSPPIDGYLLAFLRIFNMNEEQLDHWLGSERGDDLQYSDCALDTLLEKKTWTFLQMRMKLLLSAYKSTVEEDEKFISESSASPNQILAIRMVATEKRILNCVLEYAEQYVKQ
ncbi:hypothetical protein Trydic_g379 [Trypoxylus dichotomus]